MSEALAEMRRRMMADEELSEQEFEARAYRIALEAHEDRLKLWEDLHTAVPQRGVESKQPHKYAAHSPDCDLRVYGEDVCISCTCGVDDAPQGVEDAEVNAEFQETGRMWFGNRSRIPPGYEEVMCQTHRMTPPCPFCKPSPQRSNI